MRILVTGHAGYIGQVMVPFLRERGHEVHGLDTFFYEQGQFEGEAPAVPCVRKDLRDVEPSDLEGFDAVFFLAALSNDALGDLDPDLTYAINERATVRCAEMAKAAGVPRFVFASSCSLYGAQGEDFLTETAELHPVTPYGETKINVERALSRLADGDFHPTYMRNATAYGASPNLRLDIVVNNLTGYAYTTGEVLMKSDGMPWRPLVHIEDISRAFLAVAEAPVDAVHDEAFNVGRTEENYRVREVAEIVARVVPDCRVEFAAGASPDLRNYRVDFSKIRRHLPGFETEWTVERGARQLYEAYRDHGMTREEFESSRYLRIRTILGHREAGRLDDQLRWTTATR